MFYNLSIAEKDVPCLHAGAESDQWDGCQRDAKRQDWKGKDNILQCHWGRRAHSRGEAHVRQVP